MKRCAWGRHRGGVILRLEGLLAVVLFWAPLLSYVHVHVHSHAPAAQLTCEDDGVHLAHHPDAPDLSQADGCPACAFRIQSAALPVVPAVFRAVPARAHLRVSEPCQPLSLVETASCRGPPLA